MSNGHGLLLKGLDGSNPLAFLAALGTLRTLTLALPNEAVKMSWEQQDGAWRPRIASLFASPGETIGVIARHLVKLGSDNHPAMAWSAWMTKDADKVRSRFVAASMIDDRCTSYTSAVGSDAAPPSDEEGLLDNPLRAARTDYFIKNLAAIIDRCDETHLESALFSRWDYADAMENQSLRLDASEDRRHAYQWSAPTLDDSRKKRGTMLGANRLAIEAYEYFQSCMNGRTLATVAFGPKEGGRRRLRWPIWRCSCTDAVVRSLLTLGAIWQDPAHFDHPELRAMGVAALFECMRIRVGDSNPRTNFSPSATIF